MRSAPRRGFRWRAQAPLYLARNRLGPALVRGVDFGVIGGPGERLAAVTGFFDAVPAA